MHGSSTIHLALAWFFFVSALHICVNPLPASVYLDAALSIAAGLQANAHSQPTTSPIAAVLSPAHTFLVPNSISTSTAFIALNAPHLPFADLGVLSTAFGRYFKDLLSSGPVAAQLTSPFSKVMPLHAQVHPAQVQSVAASCTSTLRAATRCLPVLHALLRQLFAAPFRHIVLWDMHRQRKTAVRYSEADCSILSNLLFVMQVIEGQVKDPFIRNW